MALPANITAESDSNVLTIAASNNKGCQGRTIDDVLSPGLLPAT